MSAARLSEHPAAGLRRAGCSALIVRRTYGKTG
jgi:hypothetical protein